MKPLAKWSVFKHADYIERKGRRDIGVYVLSTEEEKIGGRREGHLHEYLN